MMGKTKISYGETGLVFLLSAMVIAAAAVLRASPAPVARTAWDGSPIAWRFDGLSRSIEAVGVNDCMVLETNRSAKIVLAANVTPKSSASRSWATFGVGVTDDGKNYWRLSFVQAPQGKDGKEGRRFFELSEMRGGRWLAQNHDGLVSAGERRNASWSYGKTYRMSLKIDATCIQGEVRETEGKLLCSAKYLFPEPSADGKVKAVVCGRPSLHTTGSFAGVFSGVDVGCSDFRPEASAAKAFPPYGSESFVPGSREPSTGFFRVAKCSDGKWWAIDPLGRRTAPLGVNHVNYRGQWSRRTMRSIHHETNLRRFPNRSDWTANAVAWLKSWGFNMLGGGSDADVEHRGLFHAFTLAMGEAVCRDGVPEEFFICPYEHRPCTSFPNVFHPDFEAWCDHVARKRCAPNKDDPWLFGYFIDNELAWWGRGKLDAGLFDAVAGLPDGHPARKAQMRFLAERKLDGDVPASAKLEFLRLAAERYFSIASAAIRRADPNHLVLGARFAGVRGAHPAVWEVAGKYCDVVTLNCYPWADLDRNVVRMDRSPDSETLGETFGKLYGLARRPLLVTEWSFPALDTGRPCSHGAGQRFRTQALRARASELFARTLLSLPYVLGYNYFMWVDQPAAGLSDAFPEDCNYGLISEEGVPYRELTSAFSELHRDIGALRNAGLPRERPFSPSPAILAHDAERRIGVCRDAGYARNGDRYAISTPGGMLLEGRVGGKDIFSSVKVGGTELGRFNMMLCDKAGGKLRWRNLSRVRSAEWKDGALEVVAEGGTAAARFSFACRIVPLSGRGRFLCDLVRVTNLGDSGMDVSSLLFRQYVGYAEDKAKMAEFKNPPGLWNAPDADAWFRMSDRAFFGGFTRAGTVVRFRYSASAGGRVQHPDAQFEPAERLSLAPGESYAPEGSVWMVAVCGSHGGRDAWNAAVDELVLMCTRKTGLER